MRSFSRRVTSSSASALVTLQLRGLHDREDCAEPLVSTIAPWSTHRFLSNGEAGSSRPRSGARLPRHPTGRRGRVCPRRAGSRTWLDEIAHSLEVDDQIARHRPLLLPGEDAGEVLVAPQRPWASWGFFGVHPKRRL